MCRVSGHLAQAATQECHPPTLCRAPVWKVEARPFPAVSSFPPAAKDLGASCLRGQVEQVDMPGTASSQLVSWPQPNLGSKARLGSQPLQPQPLPQSCSLVPQRSQPQTTGVGAWQVEGHRGTPQGRGHLRPAPVPARTQFFWGPPPPPVLWSSLAGKEQNLQLTSMQQFERTRHPRGLTWKWVGGM